MVTLSTRKLVEPVLTDLLRSRPPTAARNGLLTLIDAALEDAGHVARRADLTVASRPLVEALDAADVRDVARALAERGGRAPREAERALRSPDLIDACVSALEGLDCLDLVPTLRAWAAPGHREVVLPPRALDDAERRELADALLRRASQIGAAMADRTAGLRWADVPKIDGRTLKATGAAWQRPEVTGQEYPPLVTQTARYPNRVGRVSAALAFVRMRAALRSAAPDLMVTDPILLLAAVAETVSPVDPEDPNVRTQAVQGRFRPRVKEGDPAQRFLRLAHIWEVFDSWGHTDSRKAAVAPTAWNLPPVQADVLVWAVISAASRLAVAAEREVSELRPLREATWEDHLAAEFGKWDAGAQSAWMLMQSGREELDRTAWPAHLTPDLKDAATWPWRKERDPWADDEPDAGDGNPGGATVTPIGGWR